MNNVVETFKKILQTISRDNAARYMRHHFPAEYEELMKATEFLDKFNKPNDKNRKISIFERIYCVEHRLTDRPKCKHCGKEYVCGFNKQANEYRKWCSAKCQASDPDCIRAAKSTRLTLYGDASYHGVEKAKATRFAKNGGSWHAPDFGDKVKAGKLMNGHSPNWVNPDKSKATRLEKYGNPLFCNKEKAIQTLRANFYKQLASNDKVEPMFSIEEYVKSGKGAVFAWKCKKCGTEFESKFNYNFKCRNKGNATNDHVRCPVCYPPKIPEGTSGKEQELFNFILSLDHSATKSRRDIIYPQELDVYVSDKKLAFEFDGLYWHSDAQKEKSYHIDKSDACATKGVRLLHIFEDEWDKKKSIVESRIKDIFGIHEKTVFARKCRVKEISAEESKTFMLANHIQGDSAASVRLGLFESENLVAVMTFSKCRFDKNHEWELARFCCRLGCHVPGAAGKLLTYFERTRRPKSLVTYADKRWSVGRLYKKIGFAHTHDSRPNYFYVDGYGNRLSRIMFQKHKLASVLDKFDPEKSEAENMKANGYHRIYDCGNMVFEKIYN